MPDNFIYQGIYFVLPTRKSLLRAVRCPGNELDTDSVSQCTTRDVERPRQSARIFHVGRSDDPFVAESIVDAVATLCDGFPVE